MPALLANCVLETCNNPGTGTLQLQGAAPGRESFLEGFGSGVQAYYVLTDGTQTEAGVGTVTAGAPNTLSRDTVLWNSAGTTARLNFTGACQVFSDLPAERSPLFSADNLTLPMGGRRLAALAAGTAADDGPRLDQVAWRQLAAVDIGTPQVSAIFSLPSALSRFRLEWTGLVASASANLGLIFSLDGGTTFKTGAGDYQWTLGDVRTSGLSAYAGTAAVLFTGLATPYACFGFAEFTASRTVISMNQCVQGGTPTLSTTFGGGLSNFAGAATHTALLFSGANMTSGRVRLLGGL